MPKKGQSWWGLKAAVLPDNDAANPVRIHWFPDPPGNDPLKNRFARTIRLWREAPSAPLEGLAAVAIYGVQMLNAELELAARTG